MRHVNDLWYRQDGGEINPSVTHTITTRKYYVSQKVLDTTQYTLQWEILCASCSRESNILFGPQPRYGPRATATAYTTCGVTWGSEGGDCEAVSLDVTSSVIVG